MEQGTWRTVLAGDFALAARFVLGRHRWAGWTVLLGTAPAVTRRHYRAAGIAGAALISSAAEGGAEVAVGEIT